jgi:aryl-alcohol dehydrogenase-like predicted oxidoreductase
MQHRPLGRTGLSVSTISFGAWAIGGSWGPADDDASMAALSAVDDVRPLVPEGWTMAQFALRWILMWEAVSCTIAGARTLAQARENAAAADLPAIAPEAMSALRRIYSTRLAPVVHASW